MVESFASKYSEEQLLDAVDFAIARTRGWISCGSCAALWDGAVHHEIHPEIDAGLFVGFYRQVTGARSYSYGFGAIGAEGWDSLDDRGRRDFRIARLMEFKEAIADLYKTTDEEGEQQ